MAFDNDGGPTPNLRLEKQDRGANLRTWGAPRLNRALNCIDQAIAGVVTVALTGNHTLTSTNYEEDEARNAVLVFTGTLGGAATITAPAVEKLYLVDNQANQSVILSCGGATATVRAGTVAWVFCDGTDFFVQDWLADYPAASDLEQGLANYAASVGGTANAITLTMTYPISSYTDGMLLRFRAAAANTGSTTVNVDGVGVVAVKRIGGTDLAADDILAHGDVVISYNTSDACFYIVSDVAAAKLAAETAATQAGIATTKANEASASADSAAASAAGVNLPALSAGQQTKVLRPKSDGTGYELQDTNAGAGTVVALDGGGKLPAVDGSQLTNINTGLVPLGSPVVASNSATVDVEFAADGAYDNYIIMAAGVTVSSDGVQLRCQMKVGGSYGTSSAYQYHLNMSSFGTANYSGEIGAPQSYINIFSQIGNETHESASFELHFSKPDSTTLYKIIRWSGVALNNSGGPAFGLGVGSYGSASALTGFRFYLSGGNILTGTFQLYGIRKGA